MSHEISSVMENGQVIHEVFTSGELPWHNLGQNVKDTVKSDEAIKLAHLGWMVEKRKAATVDALGNIILSDDLFNIVRDDNNYILGAVSDRYVPIQNTDAFGFVDNLVESGDIAYESAGALKHGRVIWLLANLQNRSDEVTTGDMVNRYLLFTNNHDGNACVKCFPTSVRVVCNNTLTMAINARGDAGINLRHVGDMRDKMKVAQDILKQSLGLFDKQLEKEKSLVGKQVSQVDFNGFMDLVFPTPASDEIRAINNRNAIVATVKRNFDSDPSQQMPSVRGTAWAMYNSVSQYVDHQSRTRAAGGVSKFEARMNNAIFGNGALLKQKAFDMALAI
jgi:phage/plasmid-like protein (TIGR03299 family)